jgi:hypothetical protein
MKALALVTALLALGGCATAAQHEAAHMQQVSAEGKAAIDLCWMGIEGSPPQHALRDKMGGNAAATLAMKANTQKATPEEAAQVLVLHQEYVMPCRKIELETAAKLSPVLAAIYASGYARSDANYANLVANKISWGEFLTERDAIAAQRRTELAAAAQSIDRHLQQAHNAEIQQRQAAAAAFSQWAYQQQVLQQNQQAINAANRPRMTNCQYVGTYLNCTTF